MPERLRQLEPVGCGAMAEVFRGALHGEHGTSRPVAIKRLRPDLRRDPAAVDLFVNEAKVAVRLHHPNVVQALELTRDDDGYALVCEWLECASLQQLCDGGAKLPTYAVVHVGRCVCNALEYLHALERDDGTAMGLVHRDVTPANVFVTRGGEVKLADFGVVWCKNDGDAHVAGTPEFAAPEQKRSNDIDARADIYGLGATLRAVADEVPADLAAVIDRACAPDREARYPSARDLAAALEQVSGRLGSTTARHRIADLLADRRPRDPATTSAPRLDGAVHSILSGALDSSEEVTQPDRVRPRPRPRRWLWSLAVLTVIVAGVFAWQRRAAEPESAEATEDIAVASPAASEPAPPAPAPAPEPAAPEPPAPEARARKRVQGSVSLNAVPWARVKIDGRDVGNTPLKGLSLHAGRHAVTLFNPAQRLRRQVTIEVDGNRTQTFLVDLRRGTVQKRTRP